MSTITATKNLIPTGTWTVDPVRSRVGFAVKLLGLSTVRGEFREFEGTIEIGDDPGSSRADGTVKASSVDTKQARRDEHLRSPDFLSAAEHPELRFESTSIEELGDETLRIAGELSVNGATREVELEAVVLGVATGATGEQRISLAVSGQVSRRDFGMRVNAALGSVNAAIGDEVELELEIAAVKED